MRTGAVGIVPGFGDDGHEAAVANITIVLPIRGISTFKITESAHNLQGWKIHFDIACGAVHGRLLVHGVVPEIAVSVPRGCDGVRSAGLAIWLPACHRGCNCASQTKKSLLGVNLNCTQKVGHKIEGV